MSKKKNKVIIKCNECMKVFTIIISKDKNIITEMKCSCGSVNTEII